MEPSHTSSLTTEAPPRAADRLAYGAVHLDVVDGPRALAFWRDVVGFRELPSQDDGAVRLGSGGREVIVLHPGAERRVARGHSGLYHVAVHLPDAAEFVRAVARLSAHRIAQGPTDHIFSMATYVHDPDGIMLELTLETPERFGSWEISPREIVLVDDRGRRRSPTEPLDLEPLLPLLDDATILEPLAPGARVGHVHLHVPDLAESVRFYRDLVGFDEHMVMDAIGMADLSAGGVFPHRLALNVWSGLGAPPAPPGTAGMRRAEIRVRDAAMLEGMRGRLAAHGVPVQDVEGGLATVDPAGNRLVVSVGLG